ncbi:MAG: ArnT family glycosyltransferase [Vicinamibacterales bacterium]
MSTAAALVLIAGLPGAIVFRLPWARRHERAALAADERVFWVVLVSIAWSCGVALALALAGMYRLSTLLWLNGTLSLLLAALARFNLRLEGAPAPTFRALAPALLVVLGIWLAFPSSEYVIGGKDPGTYMNEGIQIAQRGTVIAHDPVVAAVPRPYRDLFFPSHANPTYYGLRFMGFFIQDPDQGTVVGQFPHLYPVSIAIAYGLNGLSGARNTVGVWSVIGLLGFYFLARRLLGDLPALLASILLVINVIVVWFARYPNAEVVMLALLAAAMLALARALVDGNTFFAPIAGTLLGLLVFLRFDAVLALAGAIGGILLARARHQYVPRSFWLALAPFVAGAGWYLTVPMKAYFAYPAGFVENLGLPAVIAGATLVVAAVVFLWITRPAAQTAWLERVVPVAAAAMLVGLATYAWFFRQATGRTAIHDAMALRTFGWYVTTPGLALAIAGAAVVTIRSFWRDPTLLTTAGVFASFFFYKIRIVPEHFWMTRRFLPVILPASVLFAVGAVFWITARDGLTATFRAHASAGSDRDGRQGVPWGRNFVATLALIPLGWAFWTASAPVRGHVEYAGIIPHLEKIAATFGDRDLVLVESRNASDLHVLGLPLAFIYARNVLVLNTPRPEPAAFAGFLSWARQHYDSVYFMGGGGTDLLSRRIGVEAVASERFQVPEYASVPNTYPAGVRFKEFDYSVYRFVPAQTPSGTFALDVGTNDDLMLVRFFAKEQHASGMTFRWTRDTSTLSVLGMREATRTLTIWMGDGGRPNSTTPATVAVSFDDHPIGQVTLDHDVTAYTFPIPSDIAAAAASREAPARLRLTTSTWNPQRLLGVSDNRELGVVVDRVEAR